MTELELFTQARDIPEGHRRQVFLDEQCGNDVLRKERILTLLSSHERETGEVLRNPVEVWDGAPAIEVRHSDALEALQPYLGPPTNPGSLGRLGQYDVQSCIGQGGFGIVLRAVDELLTRVVAIKVMHPDLARTSPPRKRFLREARAAAKVRHDNVVQIYAVHEEPLPHLVMECVEGRTLQEHMDATGPLPAAEIVRLGRQIALGLAAAHDQGLVHRDIKPANLLLENGLETKVKLSDFGLARTNDAASITQSGVIAGTPLFMSPEQVRGEAVDARSDLFSLGSVFYTMCAGHPPFRAPNTLAVMKRVAEDAPRPIREIAPEVPEGLTAVIDRLLEKDPARRFATAREAADALTTCVTDPSRRWRPRSARVRVRQAFAGTVMIAAAVLAAVAGYRWSGNPDPVREEPSEPVASTVPLVERPQAEWVAAVKGLPPREQLAAVKDRLSSQNPTWNSEGIQFGMTEDRIVAATIKPQRNFRNLMALQGLPDLKEINFDSAIGIPSPDWDFFRGMRINKFYTNGLAFEDFSPLQGLPLETLYCWGTGVKSLEPLRGMKLRWAHVGASKVSDLAPLRGMPIKNLMIAHTRVSDLAPVSDCPIEVLYTYNNSVTSLAPVMNCPIRELYIGPEIQDFEVVLKFTKLEIVRVEQYDPDRHFDVLKAMPGLKKIQDQPAAEFLANPANQSKPKPIL